MVVVVGEINVMEGTPSQWYHKVPNIGTPQK